MRRLVGVSIAALLVVGPSGSSAGSVPVASPKSSAVLALATTYNGSRLSWLDPATLRPLERRSIALPGGAWSPVFSPRGRYVALGGLGTSGVTIVDVRRMRVTARVAAARYTNRRLEPVAWSERRRLLVLDSPQDALGARKRLLVVDPVANRVLARYPAESWSAWHAADRTLVVLERSEAAIDELRIAVRGARGQLLRAADIRLSADQRTGSSFTLPGFAVDETSGTAFLVGTETVTRIDLESLRVSSIQLSRPRSIFARALGLLEDEAQAKEGHGTGFSRAATYVGDGVLAVSGMKFENTQTVPAGLDLVDTRDGTRRTIESRASAHELSDGLLLAFGAGWNGETGTATGMGLTAFAVDGTRLWSALGDEPVWLVETAGGYGYVPTLVYTYRPSLRVVDLASGRVLRTVRGEMPEFVVRD
jgi:hypothetical protein